MVTTEPTFFATPKDFRRWLAAHHAKENELLVGFHKLGSGLPSITWPESVDEALCFGWIDGVRKRLDDRSYTIRFTPRKPTSTWSAVNIRRMAELTAEGRVQAAGLAAFEKRSEKKSAIYAYEQREEATFDAEFARRFRGRKAAWTFFQAQPPGYRQLATYWVMTAKREETREKRLEKLIEVSEAGKRI
ncbi:MAG TPA: YdeI/OmpD-associated family protein [Thermoanaerobaculia bacterium]|jgi:uncharacterized protein YdeI (YjbR/CyaY-like superfamily)|nr:YdeI/OmpD-associated family protein [Thermoanaerobaculia bacterium]